MTGRVPSLPAFAITNLAEDDQRRLSLVPDEEQRNVLYRELLADAGIDQPIDLSIAENVLIFQFLEDNVFSKVELGEDDIRYATAYGRDGLRQDMADRLGKSFGATVAMENIFGVAGVSSALQSIALGLQQPLSKGAMPPVPAESTVLLPAPCWQGFRWCFEQVARLKCVPAFLTERGEDNFELTLEDLKRTYAATDPKPRLLVLTNPHNPLGVNYDKALLESIYAWALKQDPEMHIISDEMYCHSQLDNAKPQFVSALALDATKKAPKRVHVVWGFAKDFGLSGFRTGFLISESPHVHAAMVGVALPHSLAWFTPLDSLKQRYIQQIISDGGTIWAEAMTRYQAALTASFNRVQTILVKENVPFFHAEGANSAQFFWLDLRSFLFGQTEEQLLADIKHEAHVTLLSGRTLTCHTRGYYRLCFTANHPDTVAKAVQDMCTYLRSRKAK